jgi:TRAP-type C4-dicarboxylate transport system permease small subunit
VPVLHIMKLHIEIAYWICVILFVLAIMYSIDPLMDNIAGASSDMMTEAKKLTPILLPVLFWATMAYLTKDYGRCPEK